MGQTQDGSVDAIDRWILEHPYDPVEADERAAAAVALREAWFRGRHPPKREVSRAATLGGRTQPNPLPFLYRRE